MGPTELRLRDPGSRRAVDGEHGDVRRLGGANLAGTLMATVPPFGRYSLRQHQQLPHGFWRPLSGGNSAMARRR